MSETKMAQYHYMV